MRDIGRRARPGERGFCIGGGCRGEGKVSHRSQSSFVVVYRGLHAFVAGLNIGRARGEKEEQETGGESGGRRKGLGVLKVAEARVEGSGEGSGEESQAKSRPRVDHRLAAGLAQGLAGISLNSHLDLSPHFFALLDLPCSVPCCVDNLGFDIRIPSSRPRSIPVPCTQTPTRELISTGISTVYQNRDANGVLPM